MARLPFQPEPTAVTFCPLWVTVAFQAEVTFWSPPYVQVRRQPEMAEPRLVTLTAAVYPPVHWFTV